MSITSVIFEGMRSNGLYVIAYDHRKLFVVLVLLDQPYFARARPGSNPLRVHVD